MDVIVTDGSNKFNKRWNFTMSLKGHYGRREREWRFNINHPKSEWMQNLDVIYVVSLGWHLRETNIIKLGDVYCNCKK